MAADWEESFTRYLVRSLANRRERAGLTIEQFARRCDDVVNEPGRFKPNTLQALFAGKRKSVTVDELVVFSIALGVPVASILVPFGGGEMPGPSRPLSALDTWNLLTGAQVVFTSFNSADEVQQWAIGEGQLASEEIRSLDAAARAITTLRGALHAFRYYSPDYDGGTRLLTPPAVLRETVIGSVRAIQASLREIPNLLRDHDDPLVLWARTAIPETLTEDALIVVGREFWDIESAEGWANAAPTDPAK